MSTDRRCLIDGEPGERWPADDRGLHYGDGVFETLSSVAGRLRWPELHWRRMQRGCEVLGLPSPDYRVLEREASTVAGDWRHALIKIIWTRGSGPRGYRLPERPQAHRSVAAYAWTGPQIPAPTFRLARASGTLGSNATLAGFKHLNRLEQVLAERERAALGVDEVWLCDAQDGVVGCGSSNLFVRSLGEWLTPDLASAGIAGVMRELTLQAAARLGLRMSVRSLAASELGGIDAAFVSNVRRGLQPVSALDGRSLQPAEEVQAMQQWIDDRAAGAEA